MEAIAYFNTDYFLLELQRAGVIKNDHRNDSKLLTLEKVPNITIGLVIAAKSLKKFENHIILNWIRKGRKVTSLIEEQFALYDKLSIYLQSNVYTEEDIQEWKQILDGTKYIFPEKEHRGWSQIFGNTPNLLEKVDPDNISNANVVQLIKKPIESEDEKITQNETQKKNTDDEYCKLKKNYSKVFFSHKYFLKLLQEVGAIVSNDIKKDNPIYLSKVPNITIRLVLAAKAINFFSDEEILTWIRKGRKLTPLIEKQFLLYEKLSDYLMNYIDVKDIDKWKSSFDFKYVFPSSDKDGWSLIFGEIPELCHKIDEAQKSFKQLEVQKTFKQVETSRAETDGANESFKQLETSKIECNEAQKSFKQIETSKTEIDDAKKCFNPSENPKTGESVKKFNAESDEIKCFIYNPAVSIDEMAVGETKEEDKNETINEIKQAAHTGSENDENIYDKADVEITVNEIKEDEETNEVLSKIIQPAFKESDSDQNKYIDKSNLSGNKISLLESDYLSDQIKYIEKTNTEFPNLSGNKASSSELCKDKMSQSESDDSSDWNDVCKDKMSQSENDDSSDWDDELEDLFNAVGEELTAAENDEKSRWESTNKNLYYFSSSDEQEPAPKKTKLEIRVPNSDVPKVMLYGDSWTKKNRMREFYGGDHRNTAGHADNADMNPHLVHEAEEDMNAVNGHVVYVINKSKPSLTFSDILSDTETVSQWVRETPAVTIFHVGGVEIAEPETLDLSTNTYFYKQILKVAQLYRNQGITHATNHKQIEHVRNSPIIFSHLPDWGKTFSPRTQRHPTAVEVRDRRRKMNTKIKRKIAALWNNYKVMLVPFGASGSYPEHNGEHLQMGSRSLSQFNQNFRTIVARHVCHICGIPYWNNNNVLTNGSVMKITNMLLNDLTCQNSSQGVRSQIHPDCYKKQLDNIYKHEEETIEKKTKKA